MKTTSVAAGGRRSIQGAEARLDGAQRDVCDDPGDDRGEMVPKPRLEQEDEGQQDQERAKQAAHA